MKTIFFIFCVLGFFVLMLPIRLKRVSNEQQHSKDLIILYAEGYSVEKISPVLKSIEKSGFSGDVTLFHSLTNFTQLSFPANFHFENIKHFPFAHEGKKTPHLKRFFVMFHYLLSTIQISRKMVKESFIDSIKYKYRYIISFDAKDTLFISNPSLFLEKHLGNSASLYGKQLELVVGSESFIIRDMEWNVENQKSCCPFYHQVSGKNQISYNVGELGGTSASMMHIMRQIYEEGKNNPGKICDQAILNQIIHEDPFIRERVLFADPCIGWTLSATHILEKWKSILLHNVSMHFSSKGEARVFCEGKHTSQTLPVAVHQYNRLPVSVIEKMSNYVT